MTVFDQILFQEIGNGNLKESQLRNFDDFCLSWGFWASQIKRTKQKNGDYIKYITIWDIKDIRTQEEVGLYEIVTHMNNYGYGWSVETDYPVPVQEELVLEIKVATKTEFKRRGE